MECARIDRLPGGEQVVWSSSVFWPVMYSSPGLKYMCGEGFLFRIRTLRGPPVWTGDVEAGMVLEAVGVNALPRNLTSESCFWHV